MLEAESRGFVVIYQLFFPGGRAAGRRSESRLVVCPQSLGRSAVRHMSGTASPTPARIPLNRVPLARSSYRTTPDFYSPASVSHILCYLPRALQSIITNRPRSASNMRTAWRIQATVHAVLLIRWVLCSGREGHRVLPRFRIAFAIAIAISRKTAQSVLGELSRNDDLKQRVAVRSFGDVGRKKGKKKSWSYTRRVKLVF